LTRDFKDASGNYLKSACTIYQDRNYDDAVTTCANLGMKILNTNTSNLESSMVSYLNMQFPYGSFWVEGKSGSNCATFSNDKRLSYVKTTASCSNNAYFFCEYQSTYC
jgi:hypothetical protein